MNAGNAASSGGGRGMGPAAGSGAGGSSVAYEALLSDLQELMSIVSVMQRILLCWLASLHVAC